MKNQTPFSYSFFLFSKLYDVIIDVEYAYDVLFEHMMELYSEYHESKYNDPNQPEYECIVAFLEANKTTIESQAMQNAERY